MEIFLLGIIIGFILKPSNNSYSRRGGSREVPPANYPKPPPPPKQPKVGDSNGWKEEKNN